MTCAKNSVVVLEHRKVISSFKIISEPQSPGHLIVLRFCSQSSREGINKAVNTAESEVSSMLKRMTALPSVINMICFIHDLESVSFQFFVASKNSVHSVKKYTFLLNVDVSTSIHTDSKMRFNLAVVLLLT